MSQRAFENIRNYLISKGFIAQEDMGFSAPISLLDEDDINIIIPDFKTVVADTIAPYNTRLAFSELLGEVGEIAFLKSLLAKDDNSDRKIACYGVASYGVVHNEDECVNIFTDALNKEKDVNVKFIIALNLTDFKKGEVLGINALLELIDSKKLSRKQIERVLRRINQIRIKNDVKDLHIAIDELPEGNKKEIVKEKIITLDEKISIMQHEVVDKILSGEEAIDFSKLLTSYEIEKKKAETYSIHEDIKLNQAEQELRKAKAVATREEIALEKDRLELERIKEHNVSKRWRWEQIVAVINLVITTVLAIILPIIINKG